MGPGYETDSRRRCCHSSQVEGGRVSLGEGVPPKPGTPDTVVHSCLVPVGPLASWVDTRLSVYFLCPLVSLRLLGPVGTLN